MSFKSSKSNLYVNNEPLLKNSSSVEGNIPKFDAGGAAVDSGVNTDSVGNRGNTTLDATTSTTVWDVTNSAYASVELQGNRTISIINNTAAKAGLFYTIDFVNDAVGNHTITWPAYVEFRAGFDSQPNLNPLEKTSYTFRWNGSIYRHIAGGKPQTNANGIAGVNTSKLTVGNTTPVGNSVNDLWIDTN